MKVKIKRVDESLSLPEYKTPGSVAFDLYSREDMAIPPRSLALIPTNFIIEIPAGYMLAITPRSSTPKKKGLISPHGFGIIDQDYHGEEDEIKFQVYNITDAEVKIERGERLGQASLLRVDTAEWEETDTMSENNRGGFGSTG
jgi:dUTP pyrophosphatase